MPKDTRFANWFRGRLAQMEWTQADFARRLNLSTGTVSNWATGLRLPDPKSSDLIADALGVDVDVVLELAGHRPVTIERNPDDPAERIKMMADRIDWSIPGRFEAIEGLMLIYRNDDLKKRREKAG